MGIIDSSFENEDDWNKLCEECAKNCKYTILELKDIRKEANCSLEYSHRYISDFVIIDPEIAYDDLPDNIKSVICGGEAKNDDEQEFVQAYNMLKHCLVIRKIGQFPSQAQAQLLGTSKYRKILKDKYSDYTLGIQLHASGVGAGALSKGIHELSENECKELFPAFRFVIENILDARIAKFEHDQKLKEMIKVINSVKS